MSEHYHGATICINGHVANYDEPNHQKYCSVCGKETISECQYCHAPIRGRLYDGEILIRPRYQKDMYCYECGKPYPWTEAIIKASTDLLWMDEDLSSDQKEILKNAIPDLIVEAPATPVAVASYKKYISKASDYISNALYQLLVDVVSESVKQSLFPHSPQ
jgi:hypothetical protein